MKRLKFSICIPIYNGDKWIKETIKSVHSQGFQNFGIIVFTDCL